MLKKKGTVWKASKKGGQVVYIPADITKDSQYSFKPRERINVEFDPVNQRLIVTKVNKNEE